MAEQVNVPGVGKTNRTWLFAGLAAVAGIVTFAYMRRSNEQTLPAGEGEYAPGDQWSPDAFTGATAPGGETYDPNDITTGFALPKTNAEWTQRVVDMLANAGYDITFAASTIGKYLSGQALNASEKILTQTGIAMMGNPPAGALPIISGPEPTTSPTAKPSPYRYTGWHGIRIGSDTSSSITLGELAALYANKPNEPDSVEQVKRDIIAHNPFLVTQRKTQTNSLIPRGWVIIVPQKGA